VLAWADGATNSAVAQSLGIGRTTVAKWQARFAERRLDGLRGEPWPGAPRTVTDDDGETVIVKALEETPSGAAHWSTRSIAKATGMAQSAVGRIWQAFGLKLHLTESFKLSPDPLFIDKVRDSWGST
jgi:transposase